MGSMTRQECLERVILALVITTLGSGECSEDLLLAGYDIDAAHPEMQASFIFNLESEFDIKLPDEVGDDWITVGDVVGRLLDGVEHNEMPGENGSTVAHRNPSPAPGREDRRPARDGNRKITLSERKAGETGYQAGG